VKVARLPNLTRSAITSKTVYVLGWLAIVGIGAAKDAHRVHALDSVAQDCDESTPNFMPVDMGLLE
jgi:hypothetical protein